MRDEKVLVSRRPFDTERHGFHLRPESAITPRPADPSPRRIATGFAGGGSQLMSVPRMVA